MRNRYHINQSQVEEIEEARHKNHNKSVDRRLKALLMHAEGKSRSEIAERTEYAKTYISELVSRYCNNGLTAIVESNYGGNHRNMSFEEEEALLEPFKQAAQAGQIVEISEIKRAYEEKLGRLLDNQHGLIYYVLHRHGWRKVMPRSQHPNKANDEAIEASKKLTERSKTLWQIMP